MIPILGKRYPSFPNPLLRINQNHEIHKHYASVTKLAQQHIDVITSNSSPISEVQIPQPGEISMFPEEWNQEPEILLAMNLAAVIHAEQIRRSGQPTFVQHLFPVAMIAYKKALKTLGRDEAKKTTIYGFLHDAIEDAPENGLTRIGVEELILQFFGQEIYHQVLLLTVISPKFLKREQRDEHATHEWMNKIKRMDSSTKIVKLADIYVNNDGDTQCRRSTKLAQMVCLVELLKNAAPKLAGQCMNILETGNPSQQELTGVSSCPKRLIDFVCNH